MFNLILNVMKKLTKETMVKDIFQLKDFIRRVVNRHHVYFNSEYDVPPTLVEDEAVFFIYNIQEVEDEKKLKSLLKEFRSLKKEHGFDFMVYDRNVDMGDTPGKECHFWLTR